VRFPVDMDPLTGSLPLQAPDAVQAVALADDQLMVVAVLLGIVLEPAVILTVGKDGFTDTVADWDALPPAPVQVSV
jgi:hypothetical protein